MPVGTSVISFGSTPTSESSVVVTGQLDIVSGAYCEAFIMGDSTGSNDIVDHKFAGVSFRLLCGDVVAGVGFTIFVTTIAGEVNGDFSIRWVWTNP